ncbi:hypothetical protein FHU23_003642 [Clostridium saccharobutylicum]|nr:hypothetical protein [Clostridium saccharobutylicum]MBA8898232.1 hypothetical protein [Clostridium saccharobutylicum]MBA8995740.1 hypothetical protein [Clostridium saccharobutylicum]NOV54699.1 hypothetical protein [Clostridium saccharobutylicum]NOV91904.1 hypothetical protein [Clostridium saccharobutylicum]
MNSYIFFTAGDIDSGFNADIPIILLAAGLIG